MELKEFIREIFRRIKKGRIIIVITGVCFAVLFLFLFASKPVGYTSKSTLFPLTSPVDNAISTSMLSSILGVADAPKSFSDEAAINIIELAQSRSIREAVASTRLPAFQNKTVTELLLNEQKEHKSFFAELPDFPADSASAAIMGGDMLTLSMSAKMSRNGALELYYTCTRRELVTPISNIVIAKLSLFYIDLKKRKAQDDYNFTLDKIDSLQRMINKLDKRAITMQQTTMFTPTDLLEYNLPKDDITDEKTRILRQRNMYINNRDEAVWRLQKVTPILAVLDKPTSPFDRVRPARVLFISLGLIAGFLFSILMLIARPLYRYTRQEVYKSIFG